MCSGTFKHSSTQVQTIDYCLPNELAWTSWRIQNHMRKFATWTLLAHTSFAIRIPAKFPVNRVSSRHFRHASFLVLKSLSPTGGSFDDITPPMLGESPHPGNTESKQPTRKGNLCESDLCIYSTCLMEFNVFSMFLNDFRDFHIFQYNYSIS